MAKTMRKTGLEPTAEYVDIAATGCAVETTSVSDSIGNRGRGQRRDPPMSSNHRENILSRSAFENGLCFNAFGVLPSIPESKIPSSSSIAPKDRRPPIDSIAYKSAANFGRSVQSTISELTLPTTGKKIWSRFGRSELSTISSKGSDNNEESDGPIAATFDMDISGLASLHSKPKSPDVDRYRAAVDEESDVSTAIPSQYHSPAGFSSLFQSMNKAAQSVGNIPAFFRLETLDDPSQEAIEATYTFEGDPTILSSGFTVSRTTSIVPEDVVAVSPDMRGLADPAGEIRSLQSFSATSNHFSHSNEDVDQTLLRGDADGDDYETRDVVNEKTRRNQIEPRAQINENQPFKANMMTSLPHKQATDPVSCEMEKKQEKKSRVSLFRKRFKTSKSKSEKRNGK